MYVCIVFDVFFWERGGLIMVLFYQCIFITFSKMSSSAGQGFLCLNGCTLFRREAGQHTQEKFIIFYHYKALVQMSTYSMFFFTTIQIILQL